MGRARVLGAVGDGLYTIQRLPDETYYTTIKTRLEATQQRLLTLLPQAELDAMNAEQALDAARERVNTLATTLGNADPEDPDGRQAILLEIDTAIREVAQLSLANQAAQSVVQGYRTDLTGVQKRLDTLAKGEPPATEQSWCADRTVDIDTNTEVGTIERNDEGTIAPINIVPAQSPLRGVAPVPADGVLQPREWQTAEQVLFNTAVLPGVQRHRPQYRTGTITSIDAGASACNLTLDAAESSAQKLSINASAALTDVPIVYMNCDSAAFTVGDHVIVEFLARSWNQPRVIGFVDNPQPCDAARGYLFTPVDDNATTGWPGATNSSPRWYGHGEGEEGPELIDDVTLEAGPHFWRGAQGKIVSFDHGGKGRYGLGGLTVTCPGTPDVFILGNRISTGDRNVVGAAIFRDALVIVERRGGAPSLRKEILWWTESPWDSLLGSFAITQTSQTLTPTWNQVMELPQPGMFRPWFFGPNGSKAAIARYTGSNLETEAIVRLELSGGTYDVETSTTAPVTAALTETEWDAPLSIVRSTGTSSNTTKHVSEIPAEQWQNAANIEGFNPAGFRVGEWVYQEVNANTTNAGPNPGLPWDGSNPDPSLYYIISGTPDSPPEPYPNPSLGGTRSVAWSVRTIDYAVLLQIGSNNTVTSKHTVEWRMIETLLHMRILGSWNEWSITGSSLMAVDFDAAGAEQVLTFEPFNSTYRIEQGREEIRPYATNFPGVQKGLSSAQLVAYHNDGVFPNGTTWGHEPNFVTSTDFNPGWSRYGGSGPTALRTYFIKPQGDIKIGFRIAVNGDPIPGSEIEAKPLAFPEQSTYADHLFEVVTDANWSFGWEIGGLGVPNITNNAGVVTEDVVSFTDVEIESYSLVDLDGPQGSIVIQPETIRFEPLAVQTVGNASYWMIQGYSVTGAKRLWLRGNEQTLPNSGASLPPVAMAQNEGDTETFAGDVLQSGFKVARDFQEKMYESVVAGLFTGSFEGYPEHYGFETAEMRDALVIRDGTSALMSYVETTTSRRAVFAQFNGNPYSLEATIELPTKVNLRLIGMGAV